MSFLVSLFVSDESKKNHWEYYTEQTLSKSTYKRPNNLVVPTNTEKSQTLEHEITKLTPNFVAGTEDRRVW